MKHNLKFPDGTIKTVECKLGTGITDKNGKEIFEGDIIQFSNGSKYAIRFVKNSFVASDAWGFYDLATLKMDEAEVIGNVED